MEPVLKATLSPSRIADFTSCPLKFRYRTIDRLPERPAAAAFRGTVVHKVLEDMFDLPREQRTADWAKAALRGTFDMLLEAEPEARFAVDEGLAWPDDDRSLTEPAAERFVADLHAFVERYFVIEDPSVFDATHREQYVHGQLDEDLWLHGFVDRIDVAPTGEVRIVDYKTGRKPGRAFEDKALFQLRLYALLWADTHDVPVRRLLMLYLGSGERLTHDPRPGEIEAARERVREVWTAMKAANERADWPAKPSRLCDWCAYQGLCPARSSHVPTFDTVAIGLPEAPSE